MRFFRVNGSVIAEKVKTGQRYSLRPWQYEVMARFDGKRNFEEAARDVYRLRPGAFTANGLLNFYNWLYSENLILCECESIFELVLGNADGAEEVDVDDETRAPVLSTFANRLLRDSTTRRVLALSAIIVLSLSVIRIVQVAAPIFEPPVDRLIAEVGAMMDAPAPAVSVAVSERSASDTSVEEVSLASRIETGANSSPGPRIDEPAPPRHDAGEPPRPSDAPAPTSAGLEQRSPSGDRAIPDPPRIEWLRVQLEQCRIRRDEFYLQNDEEGYRREVHRMTNLAREIGDIEKAP